MIATREDASVMEKTWTTGALGRVSSGGTEAGDREDGVM